MRRTTSLRLPEELRERLAAVASQQGTTITALLERYAREGLASDAHPGVVFRSGPTGRRAGIAGGPDVWEIVSALREATGTEEARIRDVAEQLGLHPRQVSLALGYAADHPEEIESRLALNEEAMAQVEQAHEARQRLLDRA